MTTVAAISTPVAGKIPYILKAAKKRMRGTKSSHCFMRSLQGVVKWRILTDKNLGAMPVVDLHTHSICSDGALTPSDLVARAHAAGVKVLALNRSRFW
jgi:hypothetical protein